MGDPTIGEYISAAPLAWNGLVLVGTSGGEFGIRGRIMAYDALTGREVWRFNTVPTGKEVKIPEQLFYYRLRGGRIVEIRPEAIPGGAPQGILEQIGVEWPTLPGEGERRRDSRAPDARA